jgi:hypothetical protein
MFLKHMQFLSAELVAYIGNKINDPKERSECYLASKLFSSIHHLRMGQNIFFNKDNCRDKLLNLSRIITFIKKIKPYIDELELVFDQCEEFYEFESIDLSGIDLIIKIQACHWSFTRPFLHFIKKKQWDPMIKFLFIGLSRCTILDDFDVFIMNAKEIEISIHSTQMNILEKPKCFKNVTSLTINTQFMSMPTINLAHVAHINRVSLITKTIQFNIVCPENLTHLYCYSITHEYNMRANLFTRLKEMIIMKVPIESAAHLLLIYNIPKTCQVQLYAEKNSHLAPICKHLIKNKVNVQLLYWNDYSYINCKLIQHFTGIEYKQFNHVYWPIYSSYQVPDHLKNIGNPRDLIQSMDPEQKLYWWFLEH